VYRTTFPVIADCISYNFLNFGAAQVHTHTHTHFQSSKHAYTNKWDKSIYIHASYRKRINRWSSAHIR